MVNSSKYSLFIVGIAFAIVSCNDAQPVAKAPIILGDSNTIVTETDPEQLKDLVTDLQPVIPPAEEKYADEKTAPAVDTPKVAAAVAAEKPAEAPKTVPNLPGLKAVFDEVTVLITGIEARDGVNNKYGASFLLLNGDINGSTMMLTGTITKVSQRYISIPVLNCDYGEIPLERLTLTAGWEEVKVNNNSYKITDLDPKSLDTKDANTNSIRLAVQKAAQQKRLSRRSVQELVNSVRRVRRVNQKPLSIKLRAAMWKIDGKDEKGNTFSKQIRIDVPM